MISVRIDRTVDASPTRVWEAFTTADQLAAWLWPNRWDATAEVDLRIGGRFRIASAVTGMAVVGEFVALDEPTRLVQTWRWEGEPDETLVTITLDPGPDGGTLLTIVQERFTLQADADSHVQGWNDCLDRLRPHLESGAQPS